MFTVSFRLESLVPRPSNCGALEESTGSEEKIRIFSFGIGLQCSQVYSALDESSNELCTNGWDSSPLLLLHIPLSISIGLSTNRRFSFNSPISSKAIQWGFEILGSFALCFQNLSLKSRMNSNTHSMYSSWLESFFPAQASRHRSPCRVYLIDTRRALNSFSSELDYASSCLSPNITSYSLRSQQGEEALRFLENFSINLRRLSVQMADVNSTVPLMGSKRRFFVILPLDSQLMLSWSVDLSSKKEKQQHLRQGCSNGAIGFMEKDLNNWRCGPGIRYQCEFISRTRGKPKRCLENTSGKSRTTRIVIQSFFSSDLIHCSERRSFSASALNFKNLAIRKRKYEQYSLTMMSSVICHQSHSNDNYQSFNSICPDIFLSPVLLLVMIVVSVAVIVVVVVVVVMVIVIVVSLVARRRIISFDFFQEPRTYFQSSSFRSLGSIRVVIIAFLVAPGIELALAKFPKLNISVPAGQSTTLRTCKCETVTLSSSAHLQISNTCSIFSNQRFSPTTPSVPLKE
ncbi:hypothetical protein Tco_0524898 [Tanacetum coccineum]